MPARPRTRWHRPPLPRRRADLARVHVASRTRSRSAVTTGTPGRRNRASAALSAPSAPRSALPTRIAPQLATLVSEPPPGDDWLHELKYDGYRIVARLDRGRVTLLSRAGRDWTDHFPAVAEAVARLPGEQAVLDGEVAVFTPAGTTSFQALQNVLSGERRGQLAYIAFDLLHLDGRDLSGAPLEDRKALLKQLLHGAGDRSGTLRYSDHVIGDGARFRDHACRLGLEGIVSKRRDAPYRGGRGRDWLKVKCLKAQEVVIGGFTEPEGSRIGIGALLAGAYEDGRLVYLGKVGTGFTQKSLSQLKTRLAALEQVESPFATPPTGVGRTHWVKPELVAQVVFGEWTDDGRMRHPSFQGLREDKPAREVVREHPAPLDAVANDPPPRARRAARSSTQSPAARTQSVAEVAGVRLTHPERVLYPRHGTTKRDLARFYESIADWILPHLKDRPTSLVRCPEGVDGECFYQKHIGYWAPDSVRRVRIKERTKVGEYLVVDSLPALIGLVQIGILEIHTWNSVVKRLERPDRLVLDLDPGPGVEWRRVVEAARLIRARLEDVGCVSFVKTTGGKGLHVVAPFSPGPSWEESAAFARTLALHISRENPREYVARMAKAERTGKIFIDYLRNVRGATSVAAYSTRAKPDAPVSVPLDWDELGPRLRSNHYTIANLPRRLATLTRDPWARYFTLRQKLPSPARLAAGLR
ncbi:MAG: DNA ligase D [Candidatus Rokuibacteriota bacterium]|nr:MAG: DNA ligase D [Candidatus Rokubacteria bacterium]